MRIKATVKTLSERKEGTSAATGNAWRKQTMILEWEEGTEGRTQTNRVSAAVFGSIVDQIKDSGIQPGMTVEADLHFSTRPYRQSDFVGTDVTINALMLC